MKVNIVDLWIFCSVQGGINGLVDKNGREFIFRSRDHLYSDSCPYSIHTIQAKLKRNERKILKALNDMTFFMSESSYFVCVKFNNANDIDWTDIKTPTRLHIVNNFIQPDFAIANNT